MRVLLAPFTFPVAKSGIPAFAAFPFAAIVLGLIWHYVRENDTPSGDKSR
ncbi:hypothetical protein [Rhizobium halophytocola]|nr:hypothetical protein [Rhizobium halophytocola]